MAESISLVVILISICYTCMAVYGNNLGDDSDHNYGADILGNVTEIGSESRCTHHIEVGFCIKHIQRWGYFKGDCYEFFYSGCGGNPNNFPSLESCLRHCEKLINKKGGKKPLTAKKKRSTVPERSEEEFGEIDEDSKEALSFLNEEISSESKMQGFAHEIDPIFLLILQGLKEQTDADIEQENEVKKRGANGLRMRVTYYDTVHPIKKRNKMRPHNILFPKAMTMTSTVSSNTFEDDYYSKTNSIFSRKSEEKPAIRFKDKGKISYRTVYKSPTIHQKLNRGSKFVNFLHKKILNSTIEIYQNQSRLKRKYHKERRNHKLKKIKHKRDSPRYFPETVIEPIDHPIFVRARSVSNLVTLPRFPNSQRNKAEHSNHGELFLIWRPWRSYLKSSKNDYYDRRRLKWIPYHETQMEQLLQLASPKLVHSRHNKNHPYYDNQLEEIHQLISPTLDYSTIHKNHLYHDNQLLQLASPSPDYFRLKKNIDYLPSKYSQNEVLQIMPKSSSRIQRNGQLSDLQNRMNLKRGPWDNALYKIKNPNLTETTDRIPSYPYGMAFFFKPKLKKT